MRKSCAQSQSLSMVRENIIQKPLATLANRPILTYWQQYTHISSGHYTNRFFGKSYNDWINMIYSNSKLLGQDNVNITDISLGIYRYIARIYLIVCLYGICVFVYQMKSWLFSFYWHKRNGACKRPHYAFSSFHFPSFHFGSFAFTLNVQPFGLSLSAFLSLSLFLSYFHFRIKFHFNSHPT